MRRPPPDLSLAPKNHVDTSYGRVAYLEAGDPSKPTLLFVHGIPTSSQLWRHVIALLALDYHCLAPDLLGLGDSTVDDQTPVHMDAQAEMLIELLDLLGHDTCSLIAHDQGGAAAQRIVAAWPDRVRTLTLTDCVAFDNWPVPEVARLQALWRLPRLAELLVRARLFEVRETHTPLSAFRRGVYRPARLSDAIIREYLRPLHGTPLQRRGFVRFLLAGHPRYTLASVEGLSAFERPTLVLWGGDDRYISPSWGRRLADAIPGTVAFELVAHAGHFWQEERPAAFAAHLLDFLRIHDAAAPITALQAS